MVLPLATGTISGWRLQDGRLQWSVTLTPDQPLSTDDERVYVAAGEALHAIDATDGTVSWRAPGGGTLTAPPLAHGGWVVMAAARQLIALRAADGSVVWRKEIGPVEFSPALDGELLVVSVAEGHVLALDLRDGRERWTRHLGASPGEPVVLADRVYVGTKDKMFYSLHASTGRIEDQRTVGAEVKGRALVTERFVYFAALDNMLRAVHRRGGSLRWQKGVPYRPSRGPVLLGTRVLVPGQVEAPVPAFDAETGAPAGTIDFGGYLLQTPTFARLEDGRDAVVGITGSLTNTWVMSLRAPSPVPALPVQPLTALPGQVALLPQPPGR